MWHSEASTMTELLTQMDLEERKKERKKERMNEWIQRSIEIKTYSLTFSHYEDTELLD